MSAEVWRRAMLTGHRRLTAADQDWVAGELATVVGKLVVGHATDTAISGLALGADTIWAEVALEAELELTAAIPYPSQCCDPTAPKHQTWTSEQQINWALLVSQSSKVLMVSDRDPTDYRERVKMLHARNDAMLKIADVCVAVWDEGNLRSGTSSCLRKAVSAGMPVILLNLKARKVRRPGPAWWSQALRVPTGQRWTAGAR